MDNGILGAKRDINLKLITRLKNEKDMKRFAGICKEHSKWKNHFLFKIFRNSSPKFSQPFDINHPQNNDLVHLNNNKYSFRTVCPTLLTLNEEMNQNTGTYQISFENVSCSNLKNIEVEILSNLAMFDGDDEPFPRRIGMNFLKHPLDIKEDFTNKFSTYDEDSYKYGEFQKFKQFYKLHETPINSTLTLRFNTKTGTLIFFINYKMCNMLADYFYPYNFFIYFKENNKNNVSSVRIARYKHIDTYLDDIYYNVSNSYLPFRIVKKDAKLI
jgi:hypothetical protein